MKIVAANWKMNLSAAEAQSWLDQVKSSSADWQAVLAAGVKPAVYPPSVYLSPCAAGLPEGFLLGSQNCHHEAKGAYTGEISAGMVASIGGASTLIGHSERRQYQGEDDAICHKKLLQAFAAGLYPILCVGEKLEDRQSGKAEAIVCAQVKNALEGLSSDQVKAEKMAIAYEPVWAIGTGQEAKPEDAQAMSKAILSQLSNMGFAATPVLYGGSVNGKNAGGFAQFPEVGGALVGGASLKPEEFLVIAKAFV